MCRFVAEEPERPGQRRTTIANELLPVLVSMTEADYARFVADAIPGYAADKVASGQWAEERALELSRAALDELLPHGRQTAGNHFFTVVDEQSRPVGSLWIATKEQAGRPIAYIYDIRIRPECRRMGHATRALRAAENEARRLGANGIGLHVFGHNAEARALYEALGYRATNINMFKPL
jgi:ribosomal protein S18 acetylase RimI-like enzyme